MDENLPNKVDKLFTDGLQKFKSNPSEEVWNKIAEELDERDRKIAGYSIAWKQYIVITALLMIGLSVLSRIYFHQKAIFNQESVLRSKSPFPLIGTSKTNLHGGEPESKISLHNNNQRKAAVTLNNNAVEDLAFYNSSETQLLRFTNQNVEPRLPLLLISQPALPVKMTYNPLTLIHQKKIRFKDRLSVTPYFSQEFAGYSLTDNDLTGVNGQEIEEHERNVFSASLGFYINYKISKRWILQSGISYSWSNSNIDSGTSYAVIDNRGDIQYRLNTISGYGYLKPASLTQPNVGDSVYTAKSYSQLHYITVPLVLSYQIPLRRFSLLVGAGVSFNMLTCAELETKTYGQSVPEKEYSVNMMGLKKVNFGMLVKLDIEYHFNSSLGINVIPCFKNTLSPINLESALTAYPYNFGIGAGVTYRF